MQFWKMNGAGNDFIVVDDRQDAIPDEKWPEIIRTVCERHMSIGADGFMVVKKPTYGGDYKMLFFNSDGSMGEMCGNGARCVCRYACERGYADGTVRVETTAGLVTGWRQGRDRFRIRLNTPTVLETERLLTLDGETYCCGYAELGNPGIPHLTVEIPDLLLRIDDEEALGALRMLGRKLRYHPALPKGANVNFYQVTGPQHLRQLTYERGVEDFTLACGTGAGSLAAVLTASGRMDGANVQVQTAGGDLDVEVEMEAGRVENLYLTGAALIVYSGELAEEFLQPLVIEDIMD